MRRERPLPKLRTPRRANAEANQQDEVELVLLGEVFLAIGGNRQAFLDS
jgi:hypothetical protein